MFFPAIEALFLAMVGNPYKAGSKFSLQSGDSEKIRSKKSCSGVEIGFSGFAKNLRT